MGSGTWRCVKSELFISRTSIFSIPARVSKAEPETEVVARLVMEVTGLMMRVGC